MTAAMVPSGVACSSARVTGGPGHYISGYCHLGSTEHPATCSNIGFQHNESRAAVQQCARVGRRRVACETELDAQVFATLTELR
jgi:hypothetical protein